MASFTSPEAAQVYLLEHDNRVRGWNRMDQPTLKRLVRQEASRQHTSFSDPSLAGWSHDELVNWLGATHYPDTQAARDVLYASPVEAGSPFRSGPAVMADAGVCAIPGKESVEEGGDDSPENLEALGLAHPIFNPPSHPPAHFTTGDALEHALAVLGNLDRSPADHRNASAVIRNCISEATGIMPLQNIAYQLLRILEDNEPPF